MLQSNSHLCSIGATSENSSPPASLTDLSMTDSEKPSETRLNALQAFRQHSILCDCVLKLKDRSELPAHQAVLAASSAYFRTLILRRRLECPDTINRLEICLSEQNVCETAAANVSEEVDLIKQILDFIYTGIMELDFENIVDILTLADAWQIEDLVADCRQFLLTHLDMHNCIDIWHLAEHFSCLNLTELAHMRILADFWPLAKSSLEFAQLTGAELRRFLSDDYLNVPDEEHVFECIIQWISKGSQPSERQHQLPSLINCVRFGLTSSWFIDGKLKPQMDSWNLPQDVKDAVQKVVDAWQEELCAIENRIGPMMGLQLNVPMLRPRIPHSILFSIGGWSSGQPTNFVETYDCKADRWYICDCADEIPRAYHGMAELNGLIYVVGGFDGQSYFNSVRCFNPASGQWKEVAPMYVPRCYVSLACLDGQLYAVGGFNEGQRLNTAERFDPETNQWTLIASMARSRSDASLATFDGKLYACGGYDGQEVLNCMECFDPKLNEWKFLMPMEKRRSGVGLVAYGSRFLYAIGGFDGSQRLNEVERYDVYKCRWQMVESMHSPRSNFATAILDGKIFAIGGFNGTTTVASVESYKLSDDEEKGIWEPVCSMNLNRSAVKACVVSGLHNAKDFSFHTKPKVVGTPSDSHRKKSEDQRGDSASSESMEEFQMAEFQ